MSWLQDLPTTYVLIAPIAVAVGIDQYLTILLLALVPHAVFWDVTPPGALWELSAIGVIGVALCFWTLEAIAERGTGAALAWMAVHTLIRPLAGALLAYMLLAAEPAAARAVGAGVAALLALLGHCARAGLRSHLYFSGERRAPRALISALEDVLVMGLVVLSLDRPTIAAGVVVLAGALWVRRAGTHLRSFAFALTLGRGKLWSMLGRGGWSTEDDFPAWLRRRIRKEVGRYGPAAVRGAPAAIHPLPGTRGLRTGWLLVRESTPLFVTRRGPAAVPIALGGITPTELADDAFFRRLDFVGEGRKGFLCVPVNGPDEAAIDAVLPGRCA